MYYLIIDLISRICFLFGKESQNGYVRILCYHNVGKRSGTLRDRNFIEADRFKNQIEYLFENNYKVITLDEFIVCRNNKGQLSGKAIIITFDDGYSSSIEYVLPILSKYNYKATFFVVTSYIDSREAFGWLRTTLSSKNVDLSEWLPLSAEDISYLVKNGHCIGSHTKNHLCLSLHENEVIEEELKASKNYLEELLSMPIKYFAYPYGCLNGIVVDAVKRAGYDAAVTVNEGSNTLASDLMMLKRTPIRGDDDFATFKRKIAGAYDWSVPITETIIYIKDSFLRIVRHDRDKDIQAGQRIGPRKEHGRR